MPWRRFWQTRGFVTFVYSPNDIFDTLIPFISWSNKMLCLWSDDFTERRITDAWILDDLIKIYFQQPQFLFSAFRFAKQMAGIIHADLELK